MARRRPRAGTMAGTRLLARATLLALAVTVLLPILAATASPAWAAAPLVIASDAGGTPLVNGTNLGPGPGARQCVSISYTNAAADDRLRLFVASRGAELANLIDVSIEVGQGGHYGDCTGFAGSTIYAGTLGALGRDHGTELTALPVATLAVGSGEVSFRFGFAIRHDNRAQGRSTAADLIWTAGAASTPGNGGGGDGDGDGDGDGTTRLITPIIGGPAPSASSAPSKTSSKKARSAPGATGAEPIKRQAESAVVAALKAIGKFIRRVSGPVAKGMAWGLGTLPLVLLFLLIQGYIDRREPKLAQAPAYAEPDLPFDASPRWMG